VISSLIFLIFFSSTIIRAQTPGSATASATPAQDNAIQDKINDLKERLASRVAELKENSKRSFSGVVKQKEDGVITLLYKDIETKVVFNTESTVYTISSQGKKIKSDVKSLIVGQNVTAFGALDVDQKTLVVKVLIINDSPIISYGTVKSVDNKEGSFVVDSEDGSLTLDYEIGTKCQITDKDGKLSSCGLSKINEGDKVLVRIREGSTNLSKATALRILVIPQSTPSPTETKTEQ